MSPKAFTTDEKEIVRQKLIEAAKRFLPTTGIKKTSVEQLCRAAGISKGAFYLFYESKELLFLDALETEQSRIHETIIAKMSAAKNHREAFVAVISGMYKEFITNPWLLALASDEYEVLLRRVPMERIQQHIAMDNMSTDRLLRQISGLKVDPELLSAMMRMLFMGILHRKEIGDRADEAFLYMLQAVADKIFSEE